MSVRARVLTISLMSLALASPARATCPATSEQATNIAGQATAAFVVMDSDTFKAQRAAMREALGCLTDLPSPAQAATAHQVEALSWFLAKDSGLTLVSLKAMQEADPSRALPPDVAPPGGTLYRLEAEARALPPTQTQPRSTATGWTLMVDGRPAQGVPIGRDAVVLLVEPTNRVAWSGMARAAEVPPELGAGPPQVVVEAPPLPVPQPRQPGARQPGAHLPERPLFIAAGTAAVGAGVLWALAAPGALTLWRLNAMGPGPYDEKDWAEAGIDEIAPREIDPLHAQTQRRMIAAEVSTGLAVGLGVVGWTFTR